MRLSVLVAWFLRVVLCLAFLASGVMKFVDVGYAAQFAAWGYPAGFQYVAGSVEVIGALLLVVPSLTLVGVGILAADMVAATLTLLFNGGGGVVLVPLGFLVTLVALGWLRWRDHI
jgi:uncharacterized membrane protein YphA (DoxX/SURF4 family)